MHPRTFPASLGLGLLITGSLTLVPLILGPGVLGSNQTASAQANLTQGTAPEHLAPEHLPAERLAPERTTPERLAPEHLALGNTTQSIAPKVRHILNRLSFGPRPGDIEHVLAIGPDRYIQEQLYPERIPENPALQQQLSQLTTLRRSPLELLQTFRNQKRQAQQAQQTAANSPRLEATEARFARALTSNRQLQEVLVDFWFNHFNVDGNKGLVRALVGSYEETAIRPHVLGRFRDLLEATARHPAMLIYLDNWQNTAPNSPGARGQAQGLNENYARELMELHTLGVNGGYSQADVTTLARILTGWGLARPQQTASQTDRSGFFFDAKRHDFSPKTFLGQPVPGQGEAEVEAVLDRLARHPATARHISTKLAQYFVSDQPPASLVDRLSQRFLATDGDLRQVLQTLFQSPEFWAAAHSIAPANSPASPPAKFKTPYRYIISSLRATNLPVHNPRPIATVLQQLGMPLYGCTTPDGYANTQDKWLNPDAMTRRLSFATTLGSGNLSRSLGQAPDRSNPADRNGRPDRAQAQALDSIALSNTLGNAFSAQTRSVISSSPANLRAALILGSPEFMRY
jgi:uncharacterized protein (DUF1800 family)